MPRDLRLQIDDILSSIAKIEEYIRDMDFEAFSSDPKTQDAVMRNLEVIGEAGRVLPDSIKDGSSSVDWRKIVGLRNILIHEYFGISLPIIWDVVCNKLWGLKIACNQILSDLD
jgi:uncharacterized protein with HEPN domain